MIFHLYIFTHVYVLQRLKALSDGENEASIMHWNLFPLPMDITQRRKKENSLCIFFKLSLIQTVLFGTSSSSKYASHQIPGLGGHFQWL